MRKPKFAPPPITLAAWNGLQDVAGLAESSTTEDLDTTSHAEYLEAMKWIDSHKKYIITCFPALTARAINGLATALARMEADDLTDLTKQEQTEYEAAKFWLRCQAGR